MAVEKREQVFVSSTYLDLIEERQEVIQTLLEADCIPAGMELFPASDDDRWTLIQRVIDDCDYYVVVVGGRYGSVDPGVGLSYTEMEFDYAASQRKPIMGFLHGDPGKIASEKSELDPDLREKLDQFREKISSRMVKYWTTPQELGGQIAKSLIQIRKTHPAEGWVRAGNAITPEVESELSELRARVAELSAELNEKRRGPAIDVSGLASGDDTYAMHIHIQYYSDAAVKSGRTYSSNVSRWQGSFKATWNMIFSAIGPLMMDEASEEELSDQLDSLARDLVLDNVEELPQDANQLVKAEANEDVINDVKIQLFSLGLIERSERRRRVSDANRYWKLTEAGHEQLMRLRALRREVAGGAEESLADAAEGAEGGTP